MSCYHSLVWVVTLRVLSAPFTLGFVTILRHKWFQVFNWVRRMSNSFCLDFKSALQRRLRIHLDCLETYWLSDAQEQYIWFRACLKRCRGGPWGKLIHPLGIPLAPTICLSGESVDSINNSCGSYPKKEGWWHRFWMCLNPILMVYSSLFEIKSCCIKLVNYAFPCSFLGVGKGFLTNHLLLPKNC